MVDGLYLQLCKYGYCLIANEDVYLSQQSPIPLGWAGVIAPFLVGVGVTIAPYLIKKMREEYKRKKVITNE